MKELDKAVNRKHSVQKAAKLQCYIVYKIPNHLLYLPQGVPTQVRRLVHECLMLRSLIAITAFNFT